MRLYVLLLLIYLPMFLFGQNGQHVQKSNHGDQSFNVIDDTENYVYFPGGDSAFRIFMNTNLSISDLTMLPDTTGTILVRFQIDQIGKVSNVEIIKGLSKNMNMEVVRVISRMPDWEWDKRIDFKRRKICTKTLPIKISKPTNSD